MRQKLEELIKYITLSNLHELADKADLALKDWGQALLVTIFEKSNKK